MSHDILGEPDKVVVYPKIKRPSSSSPTASLSSSRSVQTSHPEPQQDSQSRAYYDATPPHAIPVGSSSSSSEDSPLLVDANTPLHSNKTTLFNFHSMSLGNDSSQGDTNSISKMEQEPPQETYFSMTDFAKHNWVETITSHSTTTESLSSLGFLSIMAATVVIHPILFVTGAATAVWAVGMVHAVEKGYEFFTDGQFQNIFWADADAAETAQMEEVMEDSPSPSSSSPHLANLCTSWTREEKSRCDQEHPKDTTKKNKKKRSVYATLKNAHRRPLHQQLQAGKQPLQSQSRDLLEPTSLPSISTSSLTTLSIDDEYSVPPTSPFSKDPSSPPPPTTPHNASHSRHPTPRDPAILAHFPPLENQVVTAEFPGLNALEFFHVFFSDHAPYSWKEFQQSMGDVEIEFGTWTPSEHPHPSTFHPHVSLDSLSRQPPLPSCSQKDRIHTFKTLTKSYFGPAYASARKTQRVTKFSTRLVIMENKTELFDIPFADRFFVMERWIVEAIKHNDKFTTSTTTTQMKYTTRLSVSVQVFMLKPCNWEKQIRSKTLSTMTEIVTSWSEKATQALDLTLRRKLERMRVRYDGQQGGKSLYSFQSQGGVSCKKTLSTTSPLTKKNNSVQKVVVESSEEELMKIHEKQLKLLEEKMASGDLGEWCSIELKHCLSAGEGRAFAKVLENDEAGQKMIPTMNATGTTITSSSSSSSTRKNLEQYFKKSSSKWTLHPAKGGSCNGSEKSEARPGSAKKILSVVRKKGQDG